MVYSSSAHTIASGPVLLGAIGLCAGAGIWLGGAEIALLAPAIAKALGCTVAGGSSLLALCWAWLAHKDMMEQRLAVLEEKTELLQADLDVMYNRLGGPEANGAPTASQLSAELKVLQHLLQQVVSRRESPAPETAPVSDAPKPADPTTPTPSLTTSNRIPEEKALKIMRDALEESRIDLYLQPIVRLPSRKVSHYEAFSRVRDVTGTVIFPDDYLYPAQSAGLVATLDNLLLFRCISLIRSLGTRRRGTRIFVNLALGSLRDRDFMIDFIRFMREHNDLGHRLVFEIAAEDFFQLEEATKGHLATLSEIGYLFSIDQFSDLNADLSIFHELNVQYLKVNAATMLSTLETEDGIAFKAAAKRRGIELIATHIEDERTVIEVLDLKIDYGQGYLFGRPKPAREENARAA